MALTNIKIKDVEDIVKGSIFEDDVNGKYPFAFGYMRGMYESLVMEIESRAKYEDNKKVKEALERILSFVEQQNNWKG